MSTSPLSQLLSQQPQTAKQLMQALQVSQPTLSRLLSAHHQIIKIGKARSTQYALKRSVRDMGAEWPVYRINTQANIQLAGTLVAIYPSAFVWRDALTGNDTRYDSLPWFLWDIRPQGFMGRSFKQVHAELALPSRLQDWHDDDVLHFLLKFGFVQSGNFLVGNDSCRHWQHLQAEVWQPSEEDSLAQCRQQYADEAVKVVGRDSLRSSAAGEQPKFGLFAIENQQASELLVKFSPPINTANGQRWSDLLVAEHLALQTLNDVGIAAAISDIVQTGGRTFLEVVRFDRTVSLGRRGMVSLEAVSNEFVGHNKNWDEQAASLRAQAKITPEDYQRILRIFAFGQLIANEDMHNGNLSFFLGDDFSLSLAPVYDMLPMRFAPTIHGEVVARELKLAMPTALTQTLWAEVNAWAIEYWARVSADQRISHDFRMMARQYAQSL